MRIVVTGGTGLIGNQFIMKAFSMGWEVVCMVRRDVRPLHSSIRVVNSNLLDPDSVRKALTPIGSFDALVHLGAVMPVNPASAVEYLTGNVVSTSVLLDMASRAGAHKFVHSSGLAVVGFPHNTPIREDHPVAPESAYLLSKWFAEELCEHANRRMEIQAISLRITSPYGSGMKTGSVLPQFVSRALNSEPIPLHGTGSRMQNFIHVKDIVQGIILSLQSKATGVFNLASHNPISMKDLAEMIVSMVPGCHSTILPSGQEDPQEKYRWLVDISKARKILGFSPEFDTETGLRELVQTMATATIHTADRWWRE